MQSQADTARSARDVYVGLNEILFEIAHESARLAEQCGAIQWSISAMLDIVDHPDLGAESHMLQDVDRIQQTLADISAILKVMGLQADMVPVRKDAIGAAIRLESLRHRLGLSAAGPADLVADDPSDVTWL